jgi:hypothetical protein
MSAAARLDERERARLLAAIGVDRYVRRGAEPAVAAEAPVPVAAPRVAQPVARAPSTKTPDIAALDRPAPTRTSLLDELGADARTPRLLLLVESPRAPDPRSKILLDAIRRQLPPHRMLAAGDVPAPWPAHVLALGGQVDAPEGTQLVTAPALHALRGNARAKRALWQSLKPLLRALRER